MWPREAAQTELLSAHGGEMFRWWSDESKQFTPFCEHQLAVHPSSLCVASKDVKRGERTVDGEVRFLVRAQSSNVARGRHVI